MFLCHMNGALSACTRRRRSREGVAREEYHPPEIHLTETLPGENVPPELFPMEILLVRNLPITVIVKTSSSTANIIVTK